MDVDTLRTTIVSRHSSKGYALAAETMVTSKMIQKEASWDVVRGGPWVRVRMYPEDTSQSEKVSACSSILDVLSLCCSGRLKEPLRDEGFGGRPWEPRPARYSSSPSGCEKRKRRGVRYGDAMWEEMKWGTSDTDGARTSAQNTYNSKRPRRAR